MQKHTVKTSYRLVYVGRNEGLHAGYADTPESIKRYVTNASPSITSRFRVVSCTRRHRYNYQADVWCFPYAGTNKPRRHSIGRSP